MFIDDHIEPMKPANADNIFEGVPTTANGLKKNNLEQHNEVAEYQSLPIGEAGDYELFTDDASDVTDDYYSLSANGRTITFHGTHYAGHKFYDAQGQLVWATNARSVALPQAVLNIGIKNMTIKTAMYNMKDAVCTDQKLEPSAIGSLPSAAFPVGGGKYYFLSGQQRKHIEASGIYVVQGKKILKQK